MPNSTDPDEMAHYELSHLDLYCLQRYLYFSVGRKWLNYWLLIEYLNIVGKSLFFINMLTLVSQN